MSEEIVRRFHIKGRVQGVGYRAWCVGEARRLGLAGWVCNRRDGGVEALVSGPETAVRELAERCHQGPRFASVTSVEAESSDPDPEMPDPFAQVPAF